LRIAESMLELLREGARPTVAQIAERAGLSERTVYHHFTERDRVLEVAAEIQVGRVLTMVEPIPTDLPVDERIRRFVEGRARLLEDISPVRRAAMLVEADAPRLRELRDDTLAAARRHVESTFAPELARFADGARERRVAALDTASTWVTWEHLRSTIGLPVEAASQVVSDTLHAVLRDG
jgi:AcrR family transcriptional regulator